MVRLRKCLLLAIPFSALILVLAWFSILDAAQPVDLDAGMETSDDRGPGHVPLGPGDVIVGPDQSAGVGPGETVTYTLTVTNATNSEKTYDVTYSSDQGFSVVVSATITVPGIPGQVDGTAQLDVMITAPPGAAGDVEDTTTITVTDPIDLDFPDTAILQTTVNTIAGVSISPPRAGSAGVGESVTYSHTVTNEGNAGDIYVILTDSSENFIIDAPLAIDVNQGASETLLVTVTVPGGTALGVTDITSITVQSSLIDTNVSALVTDTTTVGQTFAVSIQANDADQSGDPGQEVTYEYTVTNEGSGPDTINVSASSDPAWVTDWNPTSRSNVPEGGTFTVAVTVTVPLTGGAGITSQTTVVATSQGDSNEQDTAHNTTTARFYGLYMPLILTHPR